MTEIQTTAVPVTLPSGSATVSAAIESVPDARGTLLLAHGAGSRFDSSFLIGFARGMRRHGVSTVRFNFPYAEAGRRMPGPAEHAIATWAAVVEATGTNDRPIWAAGRSYGGRMASMAAAEGRIAPAGLVYLGYPLHPPGRADRPRMAHLPAIAVPQLFVSGSRDPFVDPHEQLDAAVASCVDAELVWIEGGGHGFEVAGARRTPDVIGEEVAEVVAAWLDRRF
ncbi:MAG: dienelactone hydrolase family protein [Microbacterium sp.]|nr:dienelactone hydrolase family protein [Microbacterium sp.]